MHGLWKADVDRTTQSLRNLPADEKGLVRTCLNGTFYTRDKLHSANLINTDKCPWCEQKDSAYHRNWECPHFQAERRHLDPEFSHLLPTLPKCTSGHGWILEAPLLRIWRKGLHELPEPGYHFHPAPTAEMDCLHLFVDGSCDCPKEPDTRLATWAVGVAHLAQDTHHLVARGPVPGIVQTSARAELWATVIALRYGLLQAKPFCIWTDYENAYKRITSFQASHSAPADDWNDRDLWQKIYDYVQRATRKGYLIRASKVVSHLDAGKLAHEVEQWARRGNHFVDSQAEEAREDLPNELDILRKQLRQQTAWLTKLRDQIHTTMVKVGIKATRDPERKQEAVAPEAPPRLAPCEEWAYPALRDPAKSLRCTLNAEEDTIIKRWLEGLATPDPSPRWMSWQQLLIDYQLTTHSVGPWKPEGKGKKWSSGASWHQALVDYSFPKAARWFGEYIQYHARVMGEAFKYKVQAPDSRCYARWTATVLLPIPPQRWANLEARLKEAVGLIKTSERDLQAVPPMA